LIAVWIAAPLKAMVMIFGILKAKDAATCVCSASLAWTPSRPVFFEQNVDGGAGADGADRLHGFPRQPIN
jgi:hypothetical protein